MHASELVCAGEMHYPYCTRTQLPSFALLVALNVRSRSKTRRSASFGSPSVQIANGSIGSQSRGLCARDSTHTHTTRRSSRGCTTAGFTRDAIRTDYDNGLGKARRVHAVICVAVGRRRRLLSGTGVLAGIASCVRRVCSVLCCATICSLVWCVPPRSTTARHRSRRRRYASDVNARSA